MLDHLLRAIDALSRTAAALAMVMTAAMIAIMLYEVVARYAFGAPTLWAFDLSYMLSGGLFLLATAFTLQREEHVRVDFLSSRLPQRVQDLVNATFYAVLFLPVMAAVTWVALREAVAAYVDGKVDPASPWAPLVWPFYGALSIGLLCLWLQAVAQAVRHLRRASRSAAGARGGSRG